MGRDLQGGASLHFNGSCRHKGMSREIRKMIKIAAIAVLIQCLAASSALADGCERDVLRIAKALAEMELSVDEREQISEMNAEAQELCRAGDVEGAEEVTAEAKAMLNLE